VDDVVNATTLPFGCRQGVERLTPGISLDDRGIDDRSLHSLDPLSGNGGCHCEPCPSGKVKHGS